MERLLAMIAFLARPTMKRVSPSEKSLSVVLRSETSRSIVSYRTIGPAISCGKSEMYISSLKKLCCTCTFSQWQSMT